MEQGNTGCGNVKISPILDDAASWPFEIADMNNELELGTIPAGQYAEAVWKDLKVRDDVETKSYKLAFTVTYDDGENQFQSTPYIFAEDNGKAGGKPDDNNNNNNAQPETPQEPQGGGEILAGGVTNTDPIISGGGSGGGTSTASVPRVIVTGFNTDPGDVNAGSNFKLIIHLKNTSSTTAVSICCLIFRHRLPEQTQQQRRRHFCLHPVPARFIWMESRQEDKRYFH